MKKIFFIIFAFLFFINCSKDENRRNNPFIPNYSFSIEINTTLPLYSNLQYPSNAVMVYQQGAGASNAVIVFNTGSGYVAFDASCPNQSLGSCPIMEINGIKAICTCSNIEYNLFNGLPINGGGEYSMKQYAVQVNGSILRIYN